MVNNAPLRNGHPVDTSAAPTKVLHMGQTEWALMEVAMIRTGYPVSMRLEKRSVRDQCMDKVIGDMEGMEGKISSSDSMHNYATFFTQSITNSLGGFLR